MADSLQGNSPSRAFQNHRFLSPLAHGPAFQIGGTLLSLFFKQTERIEHDRRSGLLDRIKGLRFLYHPDHLFICHHRIPELPANQPVPDDPLLYAPDSLHPPLLLYEHLLGVELLSCRKNSGVDWLKK